MRAASAPRTSNQSSSKAARRSPANWSGSHPHRTAKRVSRREAEPTIVRFPTRPETDRKAELRDEEIARRVRLIQASWTPAERERRRVEAARRQEELLMILAANDLENTIRFAVAEGEQPVLPPEIRAMLG